MKRTLGCVAGALLLVPDLLAAQAVEADSVAAPAVQNWLLPRASRPACPMPVLRRSGSPSVAMPSFQPRTDVHYHIMIFSAGCENPLAGDSAPRPRAFTFHAPQTKLQAFSDSVMRTLVFPDSLPTVRRRR